MKVHSFIYKENDPIDATLDSTRTLVLIFSTCRAKKVQKNIQKISDLFTQSVIMGASTSGDIVEDVLYEDALSVTVIQFQRTTLRLAYQSIETAKNSYEAGLSLAKKLHAENLQALFVLSDGLNVNGSQLSEGLNAAISSGIHASGALAGDMGNFISTWVVVDGQPKDKYVTAVGFYGNDIHFAFASKDGLDKFGVRRNVTRAKDNVLYELDGKPALQLYKEYLGERASELPTSGLYFPLAIEQEDDSDIIRTILGVDEEQNSITFAGDIPEGSCVSFMKANHDRVIEAASEAVGELCLEHYHNEPVLCIAISCVGRKLTLKQRTEEELEVVLDALPRKSHLVGLYSYGEISPTNLKSCELHNQTMTLTCLWETDA